MKNRRALLGVSVVVVAVAAFALGRGTEKTASAYGGDGGCTIGEVAVFAGNFAPKGWLPADGHLLPIQNNTPLFSVLGVTYGGDGKTNFALPDLRGRFIIGAGQGPGLPNHPLGTTGGESALPPSASVAPAVTAHAPLMRAGSVETMPPHLALTPMICGYGTFPVRN